MLFGTTGTARALGPASASPLGELPGLQALIGAASIAAGLLLLTLVPQRRTAAR